MATVTDLGFVLSWSGLGCAQNRAKCRLETLKEIVHRVVAAAAQIIFGCVGFRAKAGSAPRKCSLSNMPIPQLPGKHRRKRGRPDGMDTHVRTVLVVGCALAGGRGLGILHVLAPGRSAHPGIAVADMGRGPTRA